MNKILTKARPEPFYPAGHLRTLSGSGYQQWVPNYNYGYQELLPSTYLPPTSHPLRPPNIQPMSPTQSIQQFPDYSMQRITSVSPTQSICNDQLSPLATQSNFSTSDNYDSSTQKSSIEDTQDSDMEEVPLLPPTLPFLLDQQEDELEERLPLQPISHQSSSESGSKKTKGQKKVNDRITYPITEIFNSKFLSKCLTESVSRPNFALTLVTKFFTEEVRLVSNVSGQRGKNPLDKDVISAIKVASFRMWPLKSSENDMVAWRDCVKAIDEGGRRLRRKLSEDKTKEN